MSPSLPSPTTSTSSVNTTPATITCTQAPTNNSPAPTRMTTRGQAGIVKTKKIFSLFTSSASWLPTRHQKALADPN